MDSQTNSKKASPEDWHPADIVAALHKNGWTIRRLAAHHGVYPGVIAYALRKSFPKSERRIAEALGIAPSSIWPSRYADDGTRLRNRGTRRSSQKKPLKNSVVNSNDQN